MATDGAGMAYTTAVVPYPILPPTNSSDLRDSHKWSWSWLGGGSGSLDPPPPPLSYATVYNKYQKIIRYVIQK
jgi:hypothetical protein